MRTSENSVKWKSNFRECPKGEVLRIPIPRTPVHKGKKRKGGGLASPTTSAQALFLVVHSPTTRLALPRGSKLAVTKFFG
jgi:hypothetical protein